MKNYIKLAALLSISALSYGSVNESNYITLYAMKSKTPLNWSSPSKLLKTSAKNSLRKDYAPIGHFSVEIKCDSDKFESNHIFTGMERRNKKKATKKILKKKLGLGSVFYKFDGELGSAKKSIGEIQHAHTDNRLTGIKTYITKANCEKALSFVDEWIKSGSYKVYGSGQDTKRGEGGGCADFAEVIFNLATERQFPSQWVVNKKVPTKLIGSESKKVSIFKVLKAKRWATVDEGHREYRVADPSLAHNWIEKTYGKKYLTLDAKELDNNFQESNEKLETFEHSYKVDVDQREIWKSISLK